jgi:hypothetical protein
MIAGHGLRFALACERSFIIGSMSGHNFRRCVLIGNRPSLIALHRQIEREHPGVFTIEIRERKRTHRAPLGQEPLWELVVAAAVGSVAKEATGWVIALITRWKNERKKAAPAKVKRARPSTKTAGQAKAKRVVLKTKRSAPKRRKKTT